MIAEAQILSSFSPRACPRCMLTCFSTGDRGPALYICRGLSTNQLFFNKQSQFRESSNERKYLLYKGLSNFIPLAGQKNKPNSNPNKPNCQKDQMNVKSLITKDYRKNDAFAVSENKPNFQNAKNERKRFFTKGL
jgi:hypothetical protein